MMDFDDILEIRKGDDRLTMGSYPSHIEQINTAEEWEIKAEALREIFLQILGEMPDISCPLSPEVVGEKDCGDHIRRSVRYSVEPDERITAYVLIPKNAKGRLPAVLCIHPTTPYGKEQPIGEDKREGGQDRAYALELVRRGYVTISYDLMSAGERCFPGREHFDTAPFYEKHPGWSARGKDIWDAGRAVDLLATMKEVDPERIGSIGHSQGGGITIHAMSLDKRIKAGVSNCGLCPGRISKNPFNQARTGWWVGRPRLRPYCWTGKMFPVDIHEHLAMIAPRSIMVISALNDFGYTLEEKDFMEGAMKNISENVSKVFSLLNTEDRFKMVLHTEGHSFLKKYREIAYDFLDEKLQGDK